MDAKVPAADDGGDALAPKRSAVNEEGEDPCCFLVFSINSKKKTRS